MLNSINNSVSSSGGAIVVLGVIIICVFIAGVLFHGIALVVRMIANWVKRSEVDIEYYTYKNRGYILRFFYGFNLSIDIFLQLIEIFSTGSTAYFVLLDDLDKKIVVIFLILAYTASMLRNALQLKNNRKAYAAAFRFLEHGTDNYRSSSKDAQAVAALHKANEDAQRIIAEYFE